LSWGCCEFIFLHSAFARQIGAGFVHSSLKTVIFGLLHPRLSNLWDTGNPDVLVQFLRKPLSFIYVLLSL
jgi:hypothetical protein